MFLWGPSIQLPVGDLLSSLPLGIQTSNFWVTSKLLWWAKRGRNTVWLRIKPFLKSARISELFVIAVQSSLFSLIHLSSYKTKSAVSPAILDASFHWPVSSANLFQQSTSLSFSIFNLSFIPFRKNNLKLLLYFQSFKNVLYQVYIWILPLASIFILSMMWQFPLPCLT